jgi:hypothetical protein
MRPGIKEANLFQVDVVKGALSNERFAYLP